MLCPRPPNFHSISLEQVSSATLALSPPSLSFSHKRRRGARRAGQLYEQHVQEHLLATYPHEYVASPWLRFRNGTPRLEWCQPDGLLVDLTRGLITIVEIKLKHTSSAWWQIRHKYEPVLRTLFNSSSGEDIPLWQFAALEVVKWFDPDTAFPERIHLTDAPSACVPNRFHVHIWGGR